jgi:DNA-binding CsgD family transcriptional regulator
MRAPDLGLRLMRLVDGRLSRWKEHSEWDDIRAQGYLEAWQGYLRASQTGACSPLHGAWLGAQRAPAEWFRAWLGRNYEGVARPAPLLFSQLGGRSDEEESEPFEPAAPSFEAALLDRLEGEALLSTLTPFEQRVLRRTALAQESHAECARQLGISVVAVSNARYRVAQKARAAR